jgi:hypothetical protein
MVVRTFFVVSGNPDARIGSLVSFTFENSDSTIPSQISPRISVIVYEDHLPKLQEWKRVAGILRIFDDINAEDWPKDKKLNI